MAMLSTGCNEDGSFRLLPRGNSDVSQVERDIRAISQRELDVCRLQTGASRTGALGGSSGSSSLGGGSSASNRNTGSSRSADAAAWQDQLNVENRLFGSDAQENDAETFSSNRGGGFSASREGISGIDVIRRDSPSQYSIDVASNSSNTAVLYTRGVARVTSNVIGRGNQPQISVQDSAEVSLTYNLTNVRGRWQCTSFTADVLGPLPSVGIRSSDSQAPIDDGRIGW